jgi:Holliday junction DNA helicase RuvA
MIGRLSGVLVGKQPPRLLLDVHGVGYEVESPMTSFYELPALGQPVTLHTHQVVREDAQLLFGFVREPERDLFRLLIRVSGVGPKLALAILSGMTAAEFGHCVRDGDPARLVRLPGIGRKTAERLLIEMRDRLGTDAQTPALRPAGAAMSSRDEAVSALVALGYRPPEAAQRVEAVAQEGLACEEIIRRALQSIGSRR